jgi:hypothetical protein
MVGLTTAMWCLTHVEHIVGVDKDVQTAIRLAKRMIVDGRMPSPEDAIASLKAGRLLVVDEPRGERCRSL